MISSNCVWLILGCVILVSTAGMGSEDRHESGKYATQVPQAKLNKSEGSRPGHNKSEGPRVSLAKSEWNFGQVSIGEVLSASFLVRNEGTRRLILDERGVCCGSANQEIIPPGETKKLTFEIDTSQLPLGPGQKVVSYDTNDRLHRTLVFTLVFELKSDKRFSEP
jgi:hypothetical protein